MDKKSKLEHKLIEEAHQFPPKVAQNLAEFVECYAEALHSAGLSFDALGAPHFHLFFALIRQQLNSPYSFELYNRKVRHPIDYYQFGLDFIRPLVDEKASKALGLEIATEIEQQLKRGENAVLFANHQMEPDPQAISLLLEKTHPHLAEHLIYVAGERVVTDPLAIPFSLGCDLLCIYSKRYIDHPPEDKAKKQLHNQQTMEQMRRLLEAGGKAIYVAPAGGRDRKKADGKIPPAPFDPNSIEMFHLMARKAKTPTHFYPLALNTHHLLPPPETVQIELGEARLARRAPIGLALGPKLSMEENSSLPKEERRKQKAHLIWEKVSVLYQLIEP